MSEPSFTVTQQDLDTARSGMRVQFQAFGLLEDSPNLEGFLEHQIQVVATLYAQVRWLQNTIHDMEKGNGI